MKFKWNFCLTVLILLSVIQLASLSPTNANKDFAIYDLPKCFVLRCCLIWYGFLSFAGQRNNLSRFSQSQKSLRHRGKETCCPQQSFGTALSLSLSLFLTLSFFVYLRYAYTSIIQIRSQQQASSCGLSRGLAQAALNPFSAFAFTFALLCFGCIYLALCLEALPLREAGSRAARGSASL